MYYINHIDFFSIHVNACAQKSSKRTCPGFDSVTLLQTWPTKYTAVYATFGGQS